MIAQHLAEVPRGARAAHREGSSPASRDRHRDGVDLGLGDHEGGGEDAGGVRRALRGEGDVGAPHAATRWPSGRRAPPKRGMKAIIAGGGRRGASRRRGRGAHHAAGARRADALASTCRASIRCFPPCRCPRAFRSRPSPSARRAPRTPRCSRWRCSRLSDEDAREEAERLPQKADRSGAEGRAAQAVTPESPARRGDPHAPAGWSPSRPRPSTASAPMRRTRKRSRASTPSRAARRTIR